MNQQIRQGRKASIVLPPFTFILPIILLTLGCQNDPQIPPHSANVPAVRAPILPRNESILPIRLTADLTSVQAAILNAIPGTFNADDLDAGDGKHFRFTFNIARAHDVKVSVPGITPHGPRHSIVHTVHVGIPGQDGNDANPIVAFSDGRFHVKATYSGDVESKFFPGCHLNPVYPVLKFSFRPGVSANDGRLVLGPQDIDISVDLAPGSDTQCGAFGWGNIFVPVKSKIEEAFNSPNVKGQIESAIANAHKTIPESQLFGPFSFNLQGQRAFVYPNPTSIWIGSLTGAINSAEVNMQIRAFPTIVVSDSAPSSPAGPVEFPAGNPPTGTPIKVYLPVALTYSALNTRLAQFVSTSQQLTIGGMKFKVGDAIAGDANGRLLLSLTVKGDLNGTFYIWGTPHLRANGTILDFPDLQLAIESQSAVDSIKVGLARLVFGTLSDKLKPLTTFDLAESINSARVGLTKSYTTGSVTLVLNLAPQLGPDEQPVYSRPEGVIANVMFQGSAELKISN